MTPEEKARDQIDAMFDASGWAVQTKDTINLSASRGVAVCELSFPTGEPDYTLFVDGKAIGLFEARPAGHSPIGVEAQSSKCVTGAPASLPAWHNPLPFCYLSTCEESPPAIRRSLATVPRRIDHRFGGVIRLDPSLSKRFSFYLLQRRCCSLQVPILQYLNGVLRFL